MEVTFTRGRHEDEAVALFEPQFTVFHHPSALFALFGSEWESILCRDGDRAMLHVLQRSPIGGTGFWDVEPFYGYAGPLLSTHDKDFAQAALDAYRAACRRQGIIAEIVRFQPDQRNHVPFLDLSGIEIVEARSIAYVSLAGREEHLLLRSYSSACQRQVKSARKSLCFTRMGFSKADWQQFRLLYERSLNRNRAAMRWYFDTAAYERMQNYEGVSLWGVYDDAGGQLLSATVVFAVGETVHTLFVANAEPEILQGACDLLMHGVISAFAARGFRNICLGGGRTNALNDRLLAFKRKFAGDHLLPLPIGFIAHDGEAIARLCAEAEAQASTTSESKPSNEIVAQCMGYRSAPGFANTGAFPRFAEERTDDGQGADAARLLV